jgi:hypothetical protein
MRAAVVYESWFGNTTKIAAAIAEAIAREGEVVLLSVDDPPPAIGELDLLVVGAPTHVHGLSTGKSREAALQQQKRTDPRGIGARGWLDTLAEGGGRRAAAFDTRLGKPAILTGSAARGIAKRLEHRGFALAVPPESFFILSDNSLEEGEIERAAAWAGRVAAAVDARVTAGPATAR